MIRRKKDQVLTQLPQKIRSKVSLDISTDSKRVMKKITDDLNKVTDQLKGLVKGATNSMSDLDMFEVGQSASRQLFTTSERK